MKTNIYILCVLALSLLSCRQGSRDYIAAGADSTRMVTELPEQAVSLASVITYDVTVKNSDPDDSWTAECLKGLELRTLVDLIFGAVDEGKLTAWHYHEERPLSRDEFLELERNPEFDRSRIGRVQFVEDWHFDPVTLSFIKRVKSVMLAYELYDPEGQVRGYKAAFQVFLNP